MKNLIRELILESIQELKSENISSNVEDTQHENQTQLYNQELLNWAIQRRQREPKSENRWVLDKVIKMLQSEVGLKEFAIRNELGSIDLIKKALSRVQYDKDMAIDFLTQKARGVNGPEGKIYQNAIATLNQMNNSDIKNMIAAIREEEQPEPYDDETDTFAPGPRQRPEYWDIMYKKMKQRIDPENKFDDDPDDIK